MQFKKCGKILARIVPVICVVALIVSMAAPASAAELIALNYEDYVESTTVTSDGKIFNVSLPLDKASWGKYNENWEMINIASNPVVWQVYEDETYNITCNFLGISGYYLDCSNIPDGTSVTFRWSYENMYNKIAYTVVTYTTFIVYYVDSNNNIISKSEIESEVDWDSNIDEVNSTEFATGSVSVALSVPDGAVGCRFQFRFHYAPFVKEEYVGTNPYMNIAFALDGFDLNIPVDNYYLMVQQNGKQTELLGKIEEKLEDQGQSLDEILDEQKETNDKLDDTNGKLDDTNSKLDDLNQKQDETNDKLDDLISGSDDENEEADQVEEEMDDTLADLDSAGDALDSVDRPDINTEDLVPDDLFGDDYLLLVDTIKIFWTSDLITKNLTIMAGFILLALVIHGKK